MYLVSGSTASTVITFTCMKAVQYVCFHIFIGINNYHSPVYVCTYVLYVHICMYMYWMYACMVEFVHVCIHVNIHSCERVLFHMCLFHGCLVYKYASICRVGC